MTDNTKTFGEVVEEINRKWATGVKKNQVIENAITALEHLESPTFPSWDPETVGAYIYQNITAPFKANHISLTKLDPSGESTAKQLKVRLEQANVSIQLRAAREEFKHLETTKSGYAEHFVAAMQERIKRRLISAGEELSVLDTSDAVVSNAQIEERLQRAADRIRIENNPVKRAKLEQARAEFAGIESAIFVDAIDHFSSNVERLLSEIGAPIYMLDSTGKSTNEQMQSRYNNAVAHSYILRARLRFAGIEAAVTGQANEVGANIGHYAKIVQDDIKAARLYDGQAFMADLDKTGRSSERTMQNRFDMAVAGAHLQQAIYNLVAADETPDPLAVVIERTSALRHLDAAFKLLTATGPFNLAASVDQDNGPAKLLKRTDLRELFINMIDEPGLAKNKVTISEPRSTKNIRREP